MIQETIEKIKFTPVLVGPTAVGKTDLSIQLAQELGAQILSADSMQIYRFMNIGTAKPSIDERKGIPHHLLDLINPDEPFTVADYQDRYKQADEAVRSQGAIPLITGGTGLYIRTVTRSFKFPGPPPDLFQRKKLQARAEKEGGMALYTELQQIDPKSASRIHPNDQRRIIRALEVFYSTGRTFSSWMLHAQEPINPGTIFIGLERDRSSLYLRIDRRVDQMMEDGLLDEVEWLINQGYQADIPSMQGLGYKEMVPVIQGKTTKDEAVALLKQRTRNYAKRQLTWFRKEPIKWFSLEEGEIKAFRKILSFLEGRMKQCVE
jgi:tRNA dimethylallyltransferase